MNSVAYNKYIQSCNDFFSRMKLHFIQTHACICLHVFFYIFHTYRQQEHARLLKVSVSRRKLTRETKRELKKYMEFFDEDYQCRFPDENTPNFWELDTRENVNHTRMLLIRNFKGTNHYDASLELSKSFSSPTKYSTSKSQISSTPKLIHSDSSSSETTEVKLLKQLSVNIQRSSVLHKMQMLSEKKSDDSLENIAEEPIYTDDDEETPADVERVASKSATVIGNTSSSSSNISGGGQADQPRAVSSDNNVPHHESHGTVIINDDVQINRDDEVLFFSVLKFLCFQKKNCVINFCLALRNFFFMYEIFFLNNKFF